MAHMNELVGILYGGFYDKENDGFHIYSYDILKNELGEEYVCTSIFLCDQYSTRYIDWNRDIDVVKHFTDGDWVVYSKDRSFVECALKSFREKRIAEVQKQLDNLTQNQVEFVRHLSAEHSI